MAKLILNDNTEVAVIEETVTENSFSINCEPEELISLFQRLNVDNLVDIKFVTDAGNIMAEFLDKTKRSCIYDEDSKTGTIYLRNAIDDMESLTKRVRLLESTLNEIVESFKLES